MNDFMDINQLSKEFLDNFRTTSHEVIDSNNPGGRPTKVQFNAKLFKKVKNVIVDDKSQFFDKSHCLLLLTLLVLSKVSYT